VVAGIIGAVVSVVGLILFKAFILDRVLGDLFSSGILPTLGQLDVLIIAPILFGVSVLISALTGYVTLRLYVRL